MTSQIEDALFALWLRQMSLAEDEEKLIDLWMQEARRVVDAEEVIYFKFIDSKKTLVAAQSTRANILHLENVGLDMAATEPGFDAQMLLKPNAIRSLCEFARNGLGKESFAYLTLQFDGQILGVFLLVSSHAPELLDLVYENSYLLAMLQVMQRELRILKLERQIEKNAIFDEMTGAYVESVVMTKMQQEISRARRLIMPVSILLVSIDDLADFYKTQSHESLNKFLKLVASILMKTTRQNDFVGRLANNEFLVCMPHTSKVGAATKAERWRRHFESAQFTNVLGANKKVFVSIGISEYPSLCQDVDSLLDSARLALKDLKMRGGNKVGLMSPAPKFVPDFIVKEQNDVSPHIG